MAVFQRKKSSNDYIINDKMSDDEVVASDEPPRYLFLRVNGRTDIRTDKRTDRPRTHIRKHLFPLLLLYQGDRPFRNAYFHLFISFDVLSGYEFNDEIQ